MKLAICLVNTHAGRDNPERVSKNYKNYNNLCCQISVMFCINVTEIGLFLHWNIVLVYDV